MVLKVLAIEGDEGGAHPKMDEFQAKVDGLLGLSGEFSLFIFERILNAAIAKIPNHGSSSSTLVCVILQVRTRFLEPGEYVPIFHWKWDFPKCLVW